MILLLTELAYLCAMGRKKVDDKDKIVNKSIGVTKNEWLQLEKLAGANTAVGRYIVKRLKIKNVPPLNPPPSSSEAPDTKG